MKKLASKLLAVLLIVSLLTAGLPARTFAAATSEPQSAEEVVYVKDGKYVYNWGKRGTVATFLTTYAESYYTGNYSYDTLAALEGSNVVSGTATLIYNSALGTALHSMLTSKQTKTTSYDEVKTLLKYTESQLSNTSKLTTFYTNQEISNQWDSGNTWNREHTWPNSKGLNGSDENDVAMLKPELQSANSSRGNTAYGEGSGYFDPNSDATGQNLHGDVARLLLQHLMRWGNTDKFYGSGGVIESRAILLKWLEEDPVDTWEMGRNDALQSITGVRNVFVDYPELAFKLLGKDVPDGYITPSGSENINYTINVSVNNTAYGTASLNGRTITAVPAEGYFVESATVSAGTASVTVTDENRIRVSASSDCTVTVNFAPITYVTLTCLVNGESLSSASIQAGKKAELPSVSEEAFPGYTFVGWTTGELAETISKPALYTDSYILTEDTSLYAVFARTEEGGAASVSQFTLVKNQSQLTAGAEVLVAAAEADWAMGKELVSNKSFSRVAITKSGDTIIDLDETAGIAILTLGTGSTPNTWSFYNSEIGGYLASVNYYADGGTKEASNAMLAESSLSAASSFTATFSGGKTYLTASSSNQWNYLKYNDNDSRFSCYKATSGNVSDIALYIKSGSYTTYYTTAPGAALEYTVTAVSNNTDYGTVKAVGYSIVCTPADGYELSDVTVTSGTATWTVKDNVITVTPSTDCALTVSFAEKEIPPFKYTENTPYRLAMVQKGISGAPTLYFTGVKEGNFFATTQTEADGADVFVEYVDGGYRLYFMNGTTKTYLDIYEYTSGKAGIELTATPTSVFTYDDTYDIFVAEVLGTKYTFGTYDSYNTISKIDERYFEKIDTEEYPARLVPSSTTPPAPETVHITYVVNGTTATDGDFEKGETVAPAPPSASFTGYSYKGWATDEVTTETATAPTILTSFTASTDLTLYAVFQNNTTKGYTTRPIIAPKVKLTYYVNGTHATDGTFTQGESIALAPPSASFTGYSYAGWVSAEVTSEVSAAPATVGSSLKLTEDTTIYALFQNDTTKGYTTRPQAAPTTVKVTFVANGNALGAKTYKYNESFTLMSNPLAVKGFDKAGWTDTPLPAETTTAPTLITTAVATADITYYAVYKNKTTGGYTTAPVIEPEPVMVHITYIVDGETVSSTDVEKGTSLKLTAPAKTFDGFTYKGWVTAAFSAETTTAPTILTSLTANEDTTLYAVFQNNSTKGYATHPVQTPAPVMVHITYVVDGETVSSADVEKGTSLKLTAPAKTFDGFTYKGWVTAALSAETTTAPTILTSLTANEDTTLYAVFQNNSTKGYATHPVSAPKILRGDFNEDGKVTDADAIYLLYYTFYAEDYPLNQSADLNGDGKVTDADAIYLLYYTFYPEDYPLE